MGEFVGQPQVLKAVNSAMIEQLIYEQGPVSKPQLARLTGLSLPTVGKLVDALEESGSVRSAGMLGSGAGRKAVVYETNKDSCCLLVLYYHGREYTGRVTDIAGETLFEATFPLDNTTADSAMDSTVQAIDELMRHAPNEVKVIGLGVPGVIQPDGKLLGIPQIPGWSGINLAQWLAQRYTADICMENDVKLSAVGYYHTHLSSEYENIVYIYAGNGMGSGIIINRKLYRGSTNFSGELGFMAPLTGKPPEHDYTGVGGYLETQLREIASCSADVEYQDGTPKQREVLANILGAAAANHVAVLNPDAIVFGGEAFDAAMLRQIRGQMAYYAPQESMPHILQDTCETTGIEGLILTCRGRITTRMQLIEEGGV